MMAASSIIPFSEKEAQWAARIRADLEKRGVPIGPFDIMIVGTAMAHQAILVTHNLREFSRIEGLVLEDWY